MKKMQIGLAALGLALTMLPTQAQTPPAHNETVYLTYTTPDSIIKTMHWDNAGLPEGVKSVVPDSKTSTLIVRATPDGLRRVQEIVRALDYKPRRVRINAFFVHASRAELDASGIDFALVPLPPSEGAGKDAPPKFAQVASGEGTATLFKKLTADKSRIAQAPIIITTNNMPAKLSLEQMSVLVPTTNPDGSKALKSIFRMGLDVTARINGDHTVTLSVTAVSGRPTDKMPLLTTLRTVKNGEMLMLADALRDLNGSPLVLFLTPTELTDDAPAAKP